MVCCWSCICERNSCLCSSSILLLCSRIISSLASVSIATDGEGEGLAGVEGAGVDDWGGADEGGLSGSLMLHCGGETLHTEKETLDITY